MKLFQIAAAWVSDLVSKERYSIRGSGGFAPSGVQGKAFGQGVKPPEAERIFIING